ncbi:MipA/OmpV family protein [Marinivivus vitaminiproducens]|uniref:MipA/OmpV family protein n=1 Tax=Marinivivus vitaminiproducens TaxID=3035935 RepID=UPI00279E820F|nr:MipA/OmpV family protein [Geminicoccaceae bacterium SCSIO 64248]
MSIALCLRIAALSAAVLTTAFASAVCAQPATLPEEATGPDSAAARDEDGSRPLWEIGVAAFGARDPDYPASDESSYNGLVLPYVIYRGDVLQLGERGIARGLFVDTDRVEFDVSLSGSFPVDADDNDARDGMDDLDFLGEIGPQLTLKLLPPRQEHALDLAFPIRAVLSTDLSSGEYRGLSLSPQLQYRYRPEGGATRYSASVGPSFGLNGLNDYFYTVRSKDVRAGRPRYEADNGYIGTALNLGVSHALSDSVRVYGGTQLGLYAGSANEDSPLHTSDYGVSVAGGISWSFWQSEARVPADR